MPADGRRDVNQRLKTLTKSLNSLEAELYRIVSDVWNTEIDAVENFVGKKTTLRMFSLFLC